MSDTKGEVLTLAEQMQQEFLRLYTELDVESKPERRKADIIDSIWCDVYEAVFKPDEETVKYNQHNSKLMTYNVADVQAVTEMYSKLCLRYGGVIKIMQFAKLTGIHRATLWNWNKSNNTNGYIFNLSSTAAQEENNYIIYINNNTPIHYNGNNRYCVDSNDKLSTLRFDVIKRLREDAQDSNTNGLTQDTMGNLARANNDAELGKMWEPKRMVAELEIKRALKASELPKLSLADSEDNAVLAVSDAVVVGDD